nr:hypothetical protein [Mycoplasmopsis bovis]
MKKDSRKRKGTKWPPNSYHNRRDMKATSFSKKSGNNDSDKPTF